MISLDIMKSRDGVYTVVSRAGVGIVEVEDGRVWSLELEAPIQA